MVSLTTPLQVPSLHDKAKHHTVLASDPQPFQDDSRSVSLKSGNYLIRANLYSGSTNYWVEFEIYEKTQEATDFSQAQAIYTDGKPTFYFVL